MTAPGEVPLREKIAYGCGDLSSNLMWGLTSSYLMYYYTDIYGLPVAAVGWILLFARVFDAFCDPAIGWFVDRAGGAVIPRLIRGLALPFGLVGFLCFLPLPLSPSGKILWAGVSYILFGAIYSCINTPYGALSTMIARSPHDRVDLNAFRLMGCQAGQFCIAALTIPAITLLGGGHAVAQRQQGIALFVSLLGILGSALWWHVGRTCRLRDAPAPARHAFGTIVGALLRNRRWLLCNALVFCQFIVIAAMFGFALYDVRVVLRGDDRMGGVVLTIATVAGFLGAAMCPVLARRFGVMATALSATGAQVAIYGLLAVQQPSGHLGLFIALLVPLSLAQGIISPLFYVLLATAVDAGRATADIGTAGIAYAVNTLVSKVSMGAAGFVLAQCLVAGHYAASATSFGTMTVAWVAVGFVLLPLLSNIVQFGLLLWGRTLWSAG